ncbi:hypothetical protein, partial [Neorhizobium sp. R1-B]|uniref:hypothetical protein n=1 Tax=Neorhizobium sp. R1-B TaxID=2485162 RepID=UPI001AB0285A
VALPQLRFTSLAMTSLRWDFHPQECAHAGRTTEIPAASAAGIRSSFKTPNGKTGRNRRSGCRDGQTLKPAIMFKIK